jgi:S-(hydroxymethyl)glutathione dehydrogenase/alcohol dehydrogenase
MKAAVLYQARQLLRIEDIEIDEPQPHEVLIKTKASGVCHSDLHFVDGLLSCPLPAVLGHEAAGIVEKVGAAVTYVKPGDHVVVTLSVFCGHCKQCLTGHPACCQSTDVKRDPAAKPRLFRDKTPYFQFYNVSSFAEKLLLHENALVKIDDNIPFATAALMGCAVITGFGAIFNTTKVEIGSNVAVFGCGGVGLSLIQAASITGAGKIVAIDIFENKLQIAKKFGATHLINASTTNPLDALAKIIPEGIDYAFECIGNKHVVEQALATLAPRGTLTLLGLIPENQKIEIANTALHFERKIQGCRMGSNRFRLDVPYYLDLYRQNRLKLDELVSTEINLENINAAFSAMKSGEVIRSVIVFD